jgi:hypothetical protein
VTAAGLADVGARDAHPLVLGRRRQHFPQQLAVAGLQLVAPVQRLPGRGDARRERVAHPLELFEPGDARLGVTRGDRRVEREAGEGLGSQAGELMLETTDLTPQLSACEALVASHSQLRERVSIEQIRHKNPTRV